MNFERDEAKSEARSRNGFRLLGRFDSRIFVVIYTPRPKATRIVSARKANTREVKEYENNSTEN